MKYAVDEIVWSAEDGTDEPPAFWTPAEHAERLPDVFLTMDRARRELRVPPGDTGQDELIRDQIKSAASYVARDLSLPIVDVAVQTAVEPGENDALTIIDRYAIEAGAIRIRGSGDPPGVYSQVVDDDTWSQANPINDVGAIGRISAIPNTAWPDTPDGVFAMQYSRGLAGNDPDIDIVRSLAVLKLRDLFLAIPMHRGQSAYDRLAARVRRFDTPPFQVIGAA